MIYPDIETFRRDSGPFEAIPEFRPSHLEKNYNQIFVKAPALTKDFLEKMNTEIVPKKTYLFGYEMNTKKILFICGLFLLFFTSFFGAMLMWFTDFFDDTVLSTMVISNSSKHFKMWTNPPPKALVRVHIFNYTNLNEFENRMEKKLRVQDIGPYVYEETLERVNVKFDDAANTVSYQEKRSYKFRPDLSKGRQSDQVQVPNIPLMAGTAMSKNHNYFARLGLSSMLTALDEKPFIRLPVDSYIIGYKNRLLDLSQLWTKLNEPDTSTAETVGLLSSKIGVQPNVLTMNTGKSSIDKLGLIEKLNGNDHLDYWSTEECNRIEAADGAIYPPKQVQRKQPLHFFIPQMCRALPLVYQEENNILNGSIPAYKYVLPQDVFDSVDEKPENQCYCSLSSGDCPLKGVYNITPCSYGAPMFVSNPHFFGADETLLEGVDGLKALKKRDVETYMYLHPTMGYAMRGRATFQVNIQVQKAYGVHQMERYQDGLLLPLAWFDMELTEESLPQSFINLIYDSTYTLKGVKLAFQYGFFLTTLITLVCIILVFRSKWERPTRVRRHDDHIQPTDTIEI